jgi:hypothetical protein
MDPALALINGSAWARSMARRKAWLRAPHHGEVRLSAPPRKGHDKDGHGDEQLRDTRPDDESVAPISKQDGVDYRREGQQDSPHGHTNQVGGSSEGVARFRWWLPTQALRTYFG